MKNLFTPENAAMLLIDHQIGTMSWVRSAELSDIETNTIVLANPHLTHAINTHLKTICYDIENLRVALHLKK